MAQHRRDLEKQPPHPTHRKPLIPWGGQFFLKGQKAIVGHHLQKQIRPVGHEIARGEMVNAKAVFHLFERKRKFPSSGRNQVGAQVALQQSPILPDWQEPINILTIKIFSKNSIYTN
ncbi:MAG: hypothetical protein M1379_16860 [Firmicutes bacterium]|nr:hypothetical protein [Bacillota bacterium]